MQCVVWNCANACRDKDAKKSFFVFPKDAKLREKWLQFCKRSGGFKPKTWKVCMDHFKNEDIVGDLAFKMGLRANRYLKPDAVPCIYRTASPAVEKKLRRIQRAKCLAAIRFNNKQTLAITRRESNFFVSVTPTSNDTVTNRTTNTSLPIITGVTSIAAETYDKSAPLRQANLMRNQMQENIPLNQQFQGSELNHQQEIRELQKSLPKAELNKKIIEDHLQFPEEYLKFEIIEKYHRDKQIMIKTEEDEFQCEIKTEEEEFHCEIKAEEEEFQCEIKTEGEEFQCEIKTEQEFQYAS